MDIKNIKLISNNMSIGPRPDFNTIVEQRLTVSASGRVWFSKYVLDDSYGKFILFDKEQFSIEKKKADQILTLMGDHFLNEHEEVDATDIGVWTLIITSTDGVEFKYMGSMLDITNNDGIDMSEYIRQRLPINNLWIFEDSI